MRSTCGYMPARRDAAASPRTTRSSAPRTRRPYTPTARRSWSGPIGPRENRARCPTACAPCSPDWLFGLDARGVRYLPPLVDLVLEECLGLLGRKDERLHCKSIQTLLVIRSSHDGTVRLGNSGDHGFRSLDRHRNAEP